MEVRAYQKYLRVSPRKLRLVADTVRDSSVEKALVELKFLKKRAALTLAKVIRQAVTNAVNNKNLNESGLKIKSLEIEEGPVMKRWRAISRGRAHRIFKRTSHIKVILEGEEAEKKKTTEKKETKGKKIKKAAKIKKQ